MVHCNSYIDKSLVIPNYKDPPCKRGGGRAVGKCIRHYFTVSEIVSCVSNPVGRFLLRALGWAVGSKNRLVCFWFLLILCNGSLQGDRSIFVSLSRWRRCIFTSSCRRNKRVSGKTLFICTIKIFGLVQTTFEICLPWEKLVKFSSKSCTNSEMVPPAPLKKIQVLDTRYFPRWIGE